MARMISLPQSGGVRLDTPGDNPVVVGSGVVLGPNARYGLYGSHVAPWIITNFGIVVGMRIGANLASGGSLDNEGSVAASRTIVRDSGKGYSVTHTSGTGVAFGANGTVVNGTTNTSAAIVGGKYGVSIAGTGLVTNGGTISGLGSFYNYRSPLTTALVSGDNGVGVLLGLGGSVANMSSGNIVGGAAGVLITGGVGFVANAGAITARYATSGPYYSYGGGSGVSLAAAGTVTNTGQIAGYGHGVAISGGAGSVVNDGTIQSGGFGFYGWAVSLASGGAVVNTGSIAGGNAGVLIGGGSGIVLNTGVITGSYYGTEFVEQTAGVNLEGGGTVSNAGRVGGARFGVQIGGGLGRVINTGTIATAAYFNSSSSGGPPVGVFLASGGSIDNGAGHPGVADTHAALIYGYSAGIAIYGGPATVANAGTVVGATGIQIGTGVASATVLNRGLIYGTSGTAINFGTATATLRIAAGATFVGVVVADASLNNTLRLVGNPGGTLAGIGGAFQGFDTLQVASGVWSLTGTNAADALTVRVGYGAGLTATGGLTVAHTLAITGSNLLGFGGPGTFAVAASGSITVGPGGGAAGAFTVAGAYDGNAAGAVTLQGTLAAATIQDDGSITALRCSAPAALQGNVVGDGVLALDPGAVLDVTGGLGVASVAFLGAGASTLQLGSPGAVTSLFSGFGPGDTIDLLSTVATALSFASASDVLTVAAGASTLAALRFSGNYAGTSFQFRSDGHGGTNLFLG